MLFLLGIVLALGGANLEVASHNENYPPMWESVPETLADFSVHNGTVTINPWDYLDRMAVYKILLNSTAQFWDMKEPGNKRNVLWGLPLQHAWQFHTGRLQDASNQPSSRQNSKDQTSISTKSWWACMNYYLAVIPFLAAMDAGLVETFSYDIVISHPDEFQSDFCYSIEECRLLSTELMDEWKAFFELIKTLNLVSDMSVAPLSKEEDNVLTYMWRAHVRSINVALPRCSNRLRYLSRPEGGFGKDWATAVEFIAATNFPTDFQSTNQFQIFLPHRILLEGDTAPFIPDFSEQENRVLSILQSINGGNIITGGLLLRLWKKAMCSEQGKVAGQNLLQNMITNPELVPQTMIKLIIEFITNSNCEVLKNKQN